MKTSQWLFRGISEAFMGGDDMKFARYLAYTGMHLGVLAGAAKLGIDLMPFFAHAIVPANIISFDFEIMKDAYRAAFGDRLADRDSARKDLAEAASILTMPGRYSWFEKGKEAIEISQEGYKKSFKKEYPMYEMTPMEAWLEFFGIKSPKGLRVKAKLAEMRELQADETYKKLQVREKAAEAYDNNQLDRMHNIILEAREKGIPIRPVDVVKFANQRKRVSVLRMQMKNMRKDLRQKFEAEVAALEAEMFPNYKETGEYKARRYGAGQRPLWGGTTRAASTEGEE